MPDVSILHCGGDKEIEFIEYLKQTMSIATCKEKRPFDVEYRIYRAEQVSIDTIMYMDVEKYKKKNDGFILLISKEFFDVMWLSIHKTNFLKLVTTGKRCLHIWLDVNKNDVARRSMALLSNDRSFHRINAEDVTRGLPPGQNTTVIDKIYSLLLERNNNETTFNTLNNYAVDDKEVDMRHAFITSKKNNEGEMESKKYMDHTNQLRESATTVSNLQYRHIEKLCNYLDSKGDWYNLGSVIFQNDRDAKEEIESFHLSYSGGGSPAKAFLKCLIERYPTFPVKEFKDIAFNLKRRDISNYIESLNCMVGMYFRDLITTQRENIIRYLDKDIRGIHDWRMFADTIGFSNDEISAMKLVQKRPNRYSPTECLINLLKKKHSGMSLMKIKTASSQIGRNDVAQYLDTVIDEIVMLQ